LRLISFRPLNLNQGEHLIARVLKRQVASEDPCLNARRERRYCAERFGQLVLDYSETEPARRNEAHQPRRFTRWGKRNRRSRKERQVKDVPRNAP
jgi:hypothetical protein